MRVLLVTPPMIQLNTPYPATAYLAGFLRLHTQDLGITVTQADTSIESMVREQVAAAFPDDHVLGEEEGGADHERGRVWIVDPIDATANYARGIPIWATLITPSKAFRRVAACRVCELDARSVRDFSAAPSSAGVPSATSTPWSRIARRWQRSASSM